MSAPAPGTPVIVGAGPEQLQQVRPESRYAANMRATMVGNAFNDPIVTATDPQTWTETTNIDAVAGAPLGSVSWPTENLAALNLDGAGPS